MENGKTKRGNFEMKNENRFQAELIRQIKSELPGCIVLKNDGSNTPQGFPDLLILYRKRWGALECKRNSAYLNDPSMKEPNQEYYVQLLDSMSFSRFISPENKEEVLNELYSALGFNRPARIPRSE